MRSRSPHTHACMPATAQLQHSRRPCARTEQTAPRHLIMRTQERVCQRAPAQLRPPVTLRTRLMPHATCPPAIHRSVRGRSEQVLMPWLAERSLLRKKLPKSHHTRRLSHHHSAPCVKPARWQHALVTRTAGPIVVGGGSRAEVTPHAVWRQRPPPWSATSLTQ